MNNEIREEIIRILDYIDLTPSGLYSSRKPMSLIVNDMRTSLVNELTDYIETNYIRKPHGTDKTIRRSA